MLEIYFRTKDKNGLQIVKKEAWHTSASLDYFPGYYFMNCML